MFSPGTSRQRFGQLEKLVHKSKRVRFAEDTTDGDANDGGTVDGNRERAHFKDKIVKKSSSLPGRKSKKIEAIIKNSPGYSLDDLKNSPFVSHLEVPKHRPFVPSLFPQKIQDEDAKSDTRSFNIPISLTDSREQARRCFQWLISPYDVDEFMHRNWEKEALLVQRNKPSYYSGVFSCNDLDRILRERPIQFTKNIDITSFENEERKTYNPDGRAYPAVVWDHYMAGCSIRLLNPQTYSRSVWKLNSILQEFFGCFVGANVYLTPPGTQGFAPHYDDIEAFVLQLEGRKIWKVYAPLDQKSTLPRVSSKNFRHDELLNGPLYTVELKPGDLLYFPRGFIHEAKAVPEEHSLHITISAAQQNSFGDLLELILPKALEAAIENERGYRESLPRDYSHYMGMPYKGKNDVNRDNFKERIRNLLAKLAEFVDVDDAADEMGKRTIHQSLPPVLTEREKEASILGSGEHWSAESQTVDGGVELTLGTQIRLIRFGVARLKKEEDEVRLYHTLENSYDPHHEMEPQYIIIESQLVRGVEHLIRSYPNYVEIGELPLSSGEQQLDLSNLLFDKGIVTIVPDENDEEIE
ncbi:bifunctional lysine-specific demethylase and histidyl-hydroxylase NO66 [Brevipalpus obovatus]|uniref:bifunctional lysine-specific demethylase and histidyl-hydroxylase NO66 n=1 Tax=Brevipalpus obovatus TaxID=246614 RepID=UPI003D9E5496